MSRLFPTPEEAQSNAAQSIVDDFLADGDHYPEPRQLPGGMRSVANEAILIGNFLNSQLDEDELPALLSAVFADNREALSNFKTRFESWCEDGAVAAWLIDKHPALVQRRIEELREEAAERMEVAA